MTDELMQQEKDQKVHIPHIRVQKIYTLIQRNESQKLDEQLIPNNLNNYNILTHQSQQYNNQKMRDSKEYIEGSNTSIPNNPKLLFSFNNKQLQPPINHQILSPPKLESVIETQENSMNFIGKRRGIQLSVSPKQRRSRRIEDEESSSRADSIGPSNGSTVYDEAASRYECIAHLTQQQNANLKQQNTYLLQKLRQMQQREAKVKKLYDKAKKYKTLWQQAQMQLQVLRDQCQVYKQQAEEMKKIVLTDVYKLRQKVMQTEIEPGEEVSDDRGGKQQIKSQQSTDNKSESSIIKYIRLDTDEN